MRLSVPRWLALSPSRAVAFAGVFLTLSGVLLAEHAMVIRQVRDDGLPAYVTIPALERRLAVLTEQVEVSELQRSLAQGSAEEMIRSFVLPEKPDIDRVLGLIELMRDQLEEAKMLRAMSPVHVGGDAETGGVSSVLASPVSFHAELTEEGWGQVRLLFQLSGLVTVGDALRSDELQRLLDATEQENPAGIAGVEHFLSTPLLRYVREPRSFEEEVRRSFSSPVFEETFADLLQHSLLSDARRFFTGPLGQEVIRRKFWPMRFLTLERVSIEPKEGGWSRIGIEMQAYSRKEN